MSQLKFLIPILVLILALLWPPTAAAEDPTTCLTQGGKCYAANQFLEGTNSETNADGTAMAPWLATTDQEMLDLRNAVTQALADDGYEGTSFYFAVTICDVGGCQTTWYEYSETGEEIRHWTDPGIPPEVGVPLPFPYILGGGALLGVLLVGAGIVMRRRVRRVAA